MITDSPSDINQTEGVVIRTYPSGEGDLVLRVLTPDHGKISILAKHVRTSRKRYMGSIEVFDCGMFFIAPPKGFKSNKSSLLLLGSFQAKKSPHSLRENLMKLSVAGLVCESFDSIIKETQDSVSTSLAYYEAFNLAIAAIQESDSTSELLKACFYSLKGLMCTAGFLDQEEVEIPNKGNLRIILNRIERCIEKPLLTRDDFQRLMTSATATAAATAAFYFCQAFFLSAI